MPCICASPAIYMGGPAGETGSCLPFHVSTGTNRHPIAEMTALEPVPNDPHRAIRLWLYGLAALIVVMILVGGATRLTDSGLAITEWDLVLGFIPPLDRADWHVEFQLYQTTDEFKFQNSFMTLEQFKTIYWWEWGHRFLGRLIGLLVLLPMVVFWIGGRLSPYLKKASLGLFVLVCLQGAIGWWMVKSGLIDRVDVSQIRLAIHLTTAAVFLAATIWVAQTVRPLVERSGAPESGVASGQAGFLLVIILLQFFAGGLVAGLDAGMAYNTWPDMNGALMPHGMWAATPKWTNLTDNAITVQFVHRCLAYILLLSVFAHACWLRLQQYSGPHCRRGLILLALVTMQAVIGIVTLLLQVPLFWALGHQLGGILVLVFATIHWHALRPARRTGHLSPQSESVYGPS
jgi:cytochrome c oxidase assembly protein subunit 15